MTERKCAGRASARENDGEAAAAAETADHKTYDEGDGHKEGEGAGEEERRGDRASDKTHTERRDATQRSCEQASVRCDFRRQQRRGKVKMMTTTTTTTRATLAAELEVEVKFCVEV